MKSQTTRRLHSWHVWSGLLSGINIFILSLTGAVLVFGHELNDAIGPSLPIRIETNEPATYHNLEVAPLLQAMQERHPNAAPAILGIPTLQEYAEDPEHFVYFFELHPRTDAPPANAGAEPIKYFFDPMLEKFARESDDVDIPEWIWFLHANLFAGMVGQVFLGIVGLAFLLSTVTGLLIYSPFMKGLTFGVIRRTINPRLLLADLHKLVGVVTLAFNLLMAGTGILLTLGQFLINIYSYSIVTSLEKIEAPPGSQIISVDAAVGTARGAFPNMNVRWIMFPGQLQGKHHYAAIAYRKEHFFSRIPYVALINAYDGSLTRTIDLPWYITMIYASQPLHFGDFGGLGLRIIYAFFGLASGLLSITGFVMYFIKWRRGRRARTVQHQNPEELPSTERPKEEARI